jgi:WD40 repeat protein
VTAACFSADGKWILTGDYLCRVALWRTDTRKPVWQVELTQEREERYAPGRREYPVLAVALAPDGKRALAAWPQGVAEIDREKGAVLRTTKFPKPVSTLGAGYPPTVAFLTGSDECVYYGDDERLVRFDFKANKRHPKFDLRFSDYPCLHLALSPDAKRVLVYQGQSRYAGEWDLETGELGRLFGELKGAFDEAGYTPDGKNVWFGFATPGPRVVRSCATGEPVAWPGVEALAKYAGCLWYSPDGKHAFGLPARGNTEDGVELLRTEDGKVRHRFSSRGFFHVHPLGDLEAKLWQQRPGLTVFSPDGKRVLLTRSHGDKLVTVTVLGLWDVESGKYLRTLTDSSSPVEGADPPDK